MSDLDLQMILPFKHVLVEYKHIQVMEKKNVTFIHYSFDLHGHTD